MIDKFKLFPKTIKSTAVAVVLRNLYCLLGPWAEAVKFSFFSPLTSIRPLVPFWSHDYSPEDSTTRAVTTERDLGTARFQPSPNPRAGRPHVKYIPVLRERRGHVEKPKADQRLVLCKPGWHKNVLFCYNSVLCTCRSTVYHSIRPSLGCF